MNVDKNLVGNYVIRDGYKWINAKDDCFKVYGFNWFKEEKEFNRLSKKDLDEVKKVSKNVAFLATNTSGGQIHFKTNSKKVAIHAHLSSPVCISGMSAVGQCGFDCYFGSSYDDLKFVGSSTYDFTKDEYTVMLLHDLVGEKVVVINMPLYSGVDLVEIGVDEDCFVEPSCFKNDQRIVLYGTSITQGGCANRPGLSYSNILSRQMQTEFLNYGFSGNAFGESLLASIISDIENVELIYINFEANGGTNGKMEANLKKFVEIIREKKPNIPIILCSRIIYVYDTLIESLGKRREELRLFQENLVKEFQENGDKNIYYLNGLELLGPNFYEYTTDTIHPNDAGFIKISEVLKKKFEEILNK